MKLNKRTLALFIRELKKKYSLDTWWIDVEISLEVKNSFYFDKNKKHLFIVINKKQNHTQAISYIESIIGGKLK